MHTGRTKILIFGNPMLKIDSIPIRIVPKLRERFPDIEFKEFDPNDNLENEGRNLTIIDTVQGIDRVVLITDIDSIRVDRLYSMHDFDLGHSLKLLKKMKYLDSVKILGVPMKISEKEALDQLGVLIRANLP